ncbi:hypothetical protein ES703_89090 [subsurface metagenome]
MTRLEFALETYNCIKVHFRSVGCLGKGAKENKSRYNRQYNRRSFAGKQSILMDFSQHLLIKILAIVIDPGETEKILRHLVKIGRSPPNFDPVSLN